MCNLKRNILTALIKLTSSQALYTNRNWGEGSHRPPPVAMPLSSSDCVLVQVWCGSTTIYGQFPFALIGHSMSLDMLITKYYYTHISQSITIHTMSTIYGQTPSAVVVLTHYSILLHYRVYHLPLCSTVFVLTTSLRVEELQSGRL